MTSNPAANPVEPYDKKAWDILRDGQKDTNPDRRAKAARALGLLTGKTEAPDAGEALVKASGDKDWRVRAAALGAIALREDASLISKIAFALDDKNDVVRFTVAACIAHLSAPTQETNGLDPSKP